MKKISQGLRIQATVEAQRERGQTPGWQPDLCIPHDAGSRGLSVFAELEKEPPVLEPRFSTSMSLANFRTGSSHNACGTEQLEESHPHHMPGKLWLKGGQILLRSPSQETIPSCGDGPGSLPLSEAA